MTLNIYLTFHGNCREAFDYYREVFGGAFAAFQTFADGPPEMGVGQEDQDKVMHVSLPIGSSTLMGSDTAEGFGGPITTGNNFSIVVAGNSKAHCDRLFAGLPAGGTVTMPLQETFWSSYFGTCEDRFGINWMLDHDLTGSDT